MKQIKIAHLYYDLMNLYGENGNVRFLQDRLKKQGFEAKVYFLSIEEEIDFTAYDVFYIGAGSETNEQIVLKDILKYKKEIKKAFQEEKYFIVTGNALNFFGSSIKDKNSTLESLELFPYQTKMEEFRIVGEQHYLDKNKQDIIGFSNRNSVMEKSNFPLFTVLSGCGSNPKEKVEGIQEKHFYGSYLLGPLLVRNPYFCDEIVKSICKTFKVEYKRVNEEESCYKAYHLYLQNFYKKK